MHRVRYSRLWFVVFEHFWEVYRESDIKRKKVTMFTRRWSLAFVFETGRHIFQDSLLLCDQIFDCDSNNLGYAILLHELGDEFCANKGIVEAELAYQKCFEMMKSISSSRKQTRCTTWPSNPCQVAHQMPQKECITKVQKTTSLVMNTQLSFRQR